ncbi:unnamed protein product, partial [Didymodactylos carnosus]
KICRCGGILNEDDEHCPDPKCTEHEKFKKEPLRFLELPVGEQINEILSREKEINFIYQQPLRKSVDKKQTTKEDEQQQLKTGDVDQFNPQRCLAASLNRFNTEENQQQSSRANEEVKDIQDGKVYKQIARNETQQFITLLMNVDGIQVGNSTDVSLWLITMAINEIKRSERFKVKNVITAGISSG